MYGMEPIDVATPMMPLQSARWRQVESDKETLIESERERENREED